MGPSTLINQENAPTDLPTGQSDKDIFSTEVPSFQMDLTRTMGIKKEMTYLKWNWGRDCSLSVLVAILWLSAHDWLRLIYSYNTRLQLFTYQVILWCIVYGNTFRPNLNFIWKPLRVKLKISYWKIQGVYSFTNEFHQIFELIAIVDTVPLCNPD